PAARDHTAARIRRHAPSASIAASFTSLAAGGAGHACFRPYLPDRSIGQSDDALSERCRPEQDQKGFGQAVESVCNRLTRYYADSTCHHGAVGGVAAVDAGLGFGGCE